MWHCKGVVIGLKTGCKDCKKTIKKAGIMVWVAMGNGRKRICKGKMYQGEMQDCGLWIVLGNRKNKSCRAKLDIPEAIVTDKVDGRCQMRRMKNKNTTLRQ